MNKRYKGAVYIVLSAFFFALMALLVRLAGDLPAVEKSFFRNLVALFFAAAVLANTAVATAKAELPKGQLKRTIAFWLVSSFLISAAVYTVGSWWWTLFVWLGAAAVVTAVIVLKNKSDRKYRMSKGVGAGAD